MVQFGLDCDLSLFFQPTAQPLYPPPPDTG